VTCKKTSSFQRAKAEQYLAVCSSSLASSGRVQAASSTQCNFPTCLFETLNGYFCNVTASQVDVPDQERQVRSKETE